MVLLNTGSTHILLEGDIVAKHELEVEKDNEVWKINTTDVSTRKLAVARHIELPQFSCKQTNGKSESLLKPNNVQKYRIIFGIDFLLEDRINFINSRQEIAWQGVRILIHNLSKQIQYEHANNNKDKGQMTRNAKHRSEVSKNKTTRIKCI